MTERIKDIQQEDMTKDISTRKPLEVIENKPATQEASAQIVMPAVTATEAMRAWNAYLDLKKEIVEDSDIQIIAKKKFLKKSYWRKIATFFNLTVDLVSESHEELNGELVWNFACKAIAPNGRSAIGTGSCSAYEKATMINGKPMQKGKVTKWGTSDSGKSYPMEWEWESAQPNSIHNVRTTAETRAWNRAVSNLVGGGEVSAEEVAQKPEEIIYEYEEKTQQKPVQSYPQNNQPGEAKKPLQGQVTEPQMKKIFALLREKNLTDENLKKKYGIEHMNELSKQQASEIIEKLINYRQ